MNELADVIETADVETACERHGVPNCGKCEDAARKRQIRAKAREDKVRLAAEKKPGEATTFPEYWQQQRATLTDDQRAQFEQRESDVLDLEYTMKAFLDDTEACITLDELIAEVRLEAVKGLTDKVILVVERLWTDDEAGLRKRIIARGGPTVDLLNYGYHTGLDGKLYTDFFQKFMTVSQPNTSNGYVWMQCGCGTPIISREWIPESIVRAYKEQGRKWMCTPCRGKENNSRTEVKAWTTVEYRSPASTEDIYDNHGRLRDQ